MNNPDVKIPLPSGGDPHPPISTWTRSGPQEFIQGRACAVRVQPSAPGALPIGVRPSFSADPSGPCQPRAERQTSTDRGAQDSGRRSRDGGSLFSWDSISTSFPVQDQGSSWCRGWETVNPEDPYRSSLLAIGAKTGFNV